MMTLLPMAAFAAVTSANVSPADAKAGATSDYTVAFTTAVDLKIADNDKVAITFPAGYNITGAAVAATGAFGDGTISGQTVTVPVVADVTAGAQSITVTGVKNPTLTGDYTVSVQTTKDAADTDDVSIVAAGQSRFASQVSIDKTSTQIGENNKAKVTVYVFDAFNNPVSGKEVFIASDREDTDIISSTNDGAGPADNPNVYKAKTGTDGKVEFSVYSNIVGKAKLAVGLVDDDTSGAEKSVYEYVIGNKDHTASAVELIGTVDLTYTAGSANAVSVLSTTVTGTNRANNVDNTEISFRVTAGGAPVANQEVTFSVDRSGATLNKTTAKTDAAGVVKVKVYAEKADTYTVDKYFD
jgi:hypothetical protein